ncbi:hypothetical protein MHU86_8477 [Fragilaria crotonensis]|nr:hypothetical protein MHU86_8477 [Fragilaria crotonensis]
MLDHVDVVPTPSRRGILSLIDGSLMHYDFNPALLEQSTAIMRKIRRRRRHRHHNNDVESKPSTTTSQQCSPAYFNPSHSEWTLVFFGSSTNLYSLQFRPLLAEFCQNHPDEVQCICVPNDADVEDEHNNTTDDLLLLGTGFYKLPWDHPNRSALLRLLAVTQIPTLVVVSNADGRRVTDRGVAAIELSSRTSNNTTATTNATVLFERWRRQSSGDSWMSSCTIS